VGILERVSAFGGTFHIEGTPAKGTRLTAELPMPAESADTGTIAGESQGRGDEVWTLAKDVLRSDPYYGDIQDLLKSLGSPP
jgi:hypothetical protein